MAREKSDKAVAASLLAELGGDREAVALRLRSRDWSYQRVAEALGKSPTWARRLVSGREPEPPRRTVRCQSCGWTGKRGAVSPLATPCPDCGKGPPDLVVSHTHQAPAPAGDPKTRLNIYVSTSTRTALGPHPSTRAAEILAAWARAQDGPKGKKVIAC